MRTLEEIEHTHLRGAARKWRWFALALSAVVLLLVILQVAQGRWGGLKYGNLAEWVAGIGTVGALLFAGLQVRASRTQNELTEQALRITADELILTRRSIDQSTTESRAQREALEEANRIDTERAKLEELPFRERAAEQSTRLSAGTAHPRRFGLAVSNRSLDAVHLKEIRVEASDNSNRTHQHKWTHGIDVPPMKLGTTGVGRSTSKRPGRTAVYDKTMNPAMARITRWRVEVRISKFWFFAVGDEGVQEVLFSELPSGPTITDDVAETEWAVWFGYE